jgi:hypothetical protein
VAPQKKLSAGPARKGNTSSYPSNTPKAIPAMSACRGPDIVSFIEQPEAGVVAVSLLKINDF